MHSSYARNIAAGALAALLAFGGPMATLAVAETSEEIQARLDEAKAELDGLYAQAEEAAEELNHTKVLLEETEGQIEATQDAIETTQADISTTQADIAAKQAELTEAKEILSERISSNYKAGSVSILSILLKSSSFSELVSNMYYAGKIARSDADAIESVRQIKEELKSKEAELQAKESELHSKESELEAKKSEQEELLSQQESQKAELEARAAEAEGYVANLDQELQAKLEEERIAAEEAARKAAEEEAARRAAEEAARQAAEPQQQESGGSGESGSSSSGGEATEGWRSVVVSAAYSKLGGTYVYGGSGPSVFDCSGLTSWCYAQAGIYINHSSASQVSFCNKPASQAEYGDVVWRPGHVGICIGGGQTIEAFSPGQGIGVGSVSDFQRAGSPGG